METTAGIPPDFGSYKIENGKWEKGVGSEIELKEFKDCAELLHKYGFDKNEWLKFVENRKDFQHQCIDPSDLVTSSFSGIRSVNTGASIWTKLYF